MAILHALEAKIAIDVESRMLPCDVVDVHTARVVAVMGDFVIPMCRPDACLVEEEMRNLKIMLHARAAVPNVWSLC